MNRKSISALAVYKTRKEVKAKKKAARTSVARSPVDDRPDKRQRRKRSSSTRQENGKVPKLEQCAVYDGVNGCSAARNGRDSERFIASGGSEVAAERCFDWLIQPVERDRFFRSVHLYFSRHSPWWAQKGVDEKVCASVKSELRTVL